MMFRRKICKNICVFILPTVIVFGLVLNFSGNWSVEQTQSQPHPHWGIGNDFPVDYDSYDSIDGHVHGRGSLYDHDRTDPKSTSGHKRLEPSLKWTNLSALVAKGTKFKVQRALYRFAPEVFDTFPTEFLPGIKSPCWLDVGTEELKCLPSFFLAGFPKCGTSDVYSKLYQHPGIVRTLKKEPHWWTRQRFNGSSLVEYAGNFQTLAKRISESDLTSKTLIAGDASAATAWKNNHWRFFYPTADEPLYITAELIHQFLPKSKIIFLLRDPTERAFSDYLYINFLQRRNSGWKLPKLNSVTFHADVLVSIATLTSCLNRGNSMRACSYDCTDTLPTRIAVGHYVVYLRDWIQAFPRDQIFVLRLEDWSDNCEKWLPKLYKFLDQEKLSDDTISQICKKKTKNSPRYSRGFRGELQNNTREILDAWYGPLNKELDKFLRDNNL
ncbi:carbohydrate sulfotransferase 15-like [Acanthaster planci]|uniref:Carbohydrate sulfotransferase 15-like n=1 Tax=Acanthaster planci TaxID=133434 RepID=A0A8B7ZF53_ACAPL|nr:carbohydrate sulfotransferase 15-like [Acanthaster planci]